MPIDLRNDIQFEGNGELMQGLGSYWNNVFEDRAIVNRLMAAVQDQYRQAEINTTEIVQGADISQAPVLHTQVWYRHRIYKNQQADGNILGPKYDPAGRKYGDGAQYGEGDPYLWMYEVPSTLVRPRAICNRITDASHIMYEGAGYYFAPGYIGFPFNPFASSLWPVVETDDGQAVDLWLYISDWDNQLLQQRYSLAVGIGAPSTDDYRLLLEGVWQGRMFDRGRNALYKMLEGASGVPLAHSTEVVEHAWSDDEYSYVITATEVYRVPRTTILVDVGDQLHKGQSLFESFVLTNQRDWSGYDITLPPSFFNPEIGIRYPITFPNAEVPVTYLGQDSEGRTLYHFTLYGEGQDLIRYRRYLVENNFVQVLDKRGSRQTQPGAADLVTAVNPATDIVAKLVIPNLMLAVVDRNLWPTDSVVQSHLEKQVRRFVHPHSRLLIQQQTPVDSESWSSWSSVSEGSESSSTVGSTLSTLSSPTSSSSTDTSSSSTISSSSSQSDQSTSSSSFTESSVSTSSETSSSDSTNSSSSTATASSKSSRSESTSSSSTRSSLSSNSSTSSTETSSSISSNTSSSSSSSTETSSSSSSSISTETSSSSTLWMSTSSSQSTESSSSTETSSSSTLWMSTSSSQSTETSSSSTLWMSTSSSQSTESTSSSTTSSSSQSTETSSSSQSTESTSSSTTSGSSESSSSST